MEYNEVLEQARRLAEERRPDASAQHKAAFANSVAYLVTGLSGGFGGPSVREHAADRLYAGRRFSFEEASNLLLADDGPIFGPITDLHRLIWDEESEICFNDDPEDVAKLSR